MPYKIIGSTVYHKKGSKWSKKQKCSSHAAAVKAVRLLQGVEHGWKPTGRRGRR